MNVFECIFNRRSTRSFKSDPVDDKLIGVMLYSATHAPSAGNTQCWHFVVVKDEGIKKKLAEAALRQRFITKAPVIIVVCIDKEKTIMRYGKRGEALYSMQDTANATMIMMLAAHALGLNTCWIGAFDGDSVGHILELPNQLRPVALVPVGYSDETPKKPRRIPFEQTTSVDTYGKKYDIAYAVKPGDRGKEYKFKQIGNYLEDAVKEKLGKKETTRSKEKKKMTFAEFLKRLSS
jgi:nitroreductase